MEKQLLDSIKIPAFMRKNELKRRDKKKLLITAYDRQQAALKKRTCKKQERVPAIVNYYTPSNYPKPHLQSIISKKAGKKDEPSIQYIGKIAHYYEKINVGVIELEGHLKQGDYIIVGKSVQRVDSLQINRKNVKEAQSGDEVGLKLEKQCQIGDKVYAISFV